jgi:hypothetical protein
MFFAVRIRIRGSVTLTNVSGSGCFRQWPSRRLQKIIFFPNFFAFYFRKVHLHHSSQLKSHKEVEIKGFLTTFAWWWEDLWLTDPDPEHRLQVWDTLYCTAVLCELG